jgi:hypothetical protein
VAHAVDVPLTQTEAENAIKFGQSSKSQTNIMITRGYGYGTGGDFINMWKPVDNPQMIVETPWLQLALASQKAKATYSDLDPSTVSSLIASTTLKIKALVYAARHDENSGAVIVIKQGSAVLHPVAPTTIDSDIDVIKRHRGENVSGSTATIFETGLTANFDMKALDLTKPFKVVIANTADGEWNFTVDPTKIR